MPGHASSPYWAAVDFDSEGEEDPSPNGSQRVYIDPWNSDGLGQRTENGDSSQPETMTSFAGEPVSASFYYVPTKSYESEDDLVQENVSIPEEIVIPEQPVYRRRSQSYRNDVPVYGYPPEIVMQERRRSVYLEEPIYAPHPMIYEGAYGPYIPLPYQPPSKRNSIAHTATMDYALATLARNGKHGRRLSRYADLPEYHYEAMIPEYEDWCRPPVIPQGAPENFHLSRYGHLQIDYSCSWNSLDRLIRNH